MKAHPFDADALAIPTLDDARRAELITAYLDGELSAEAARHVTTWLDDHPDALRDVEHLRRVWDVLDAYPDEPVPDDFAATVLARTVGRGLRRARPWRRAGLAAAAVLLLGVGAGLRALWAPGGGDEAGTEVARVGAGNPEPAIDEVPPDLLENVDLILNLSDDEFEGMLIADLDAPGGPR